MDWLLGRRAGTGLPARQVTVYIAAQLIGGIAGAVLANTMFDLPPVQTASTTRTSLGLWLGEVVATAGLIAVIFALARSGRAALSVVTVASWIGAAYWFTSSTSFANPAVTVGRMFSDTFTGIAPASAPEFIAAQLLGGLLGAGLVLVLYPDITRAAADVVTPPHQSWPQPGYRREPTSRPTGSPRWPKPKEHV
jgi:glycerol uptake facilitator-like aquaporin